MKVRPVGSSPRTLAIDDCVAEETGAMNRRFDLSGRVALVTGGSKGLGKAMARGLAEAGADVLISSRTESELQQALTEILEGTGRRGRYIVADMARRDQV